MNDEFEPLAGVDSGADHIALITDLLLCATVLGTAILILLF